MTALLPAVIGGGRYKKNVTMTAASVLHEALRQGRRSVFELIHTTINMKQKSIQHIRQITIYSSRSDKSSININRSFMRSLRSLRCRICTATDPTQETWALRFRIYTTTGSNTGHMACKMHTDDAPLRRWHELHIVQVRNTSICPGKIYYYCRW